MVHLCGIVGRVPVFQPGRLGLVPGRIKNFNLYPGTGCVSFVFCPVLFLAVAPTLCWPDFQGSPPLCFCLVFWSTSQLILQPFRRFTYVAAHSPTLSLLHPRHSSFSNPSFASPTSQALHLIHLASRPWSCGVCVERMGDCYESNLYNYWYSFPSLPRFHSNSSFIPI